MKRFTHLCIVTFLASAGCGSNDSTPGNLFEPNPECEGDPVAALSGQHQSVISFLEIGSDADGFDLDGDGEPDNQLSAVAGLANSALEDSFEQFELIIPLEFFDFPEVAADECVKFAIYLGAYSLDLDDDKDETAEGNGDCDDSDPARNLEAAEIPDNFIDDNCNGLADETLDENGNVVATSTNTDDMDGDGVTIADGDCDDLNDKVAAGMPEVCSDGFDNNCDGPADFDIAADQAGTPVCSPFDDTPDQIALDPLGFGSDGSPLISFVDGVVTEGPGGLELTAGPSLFTVSVPIIDELALELRITGATISGNVVQGAAGLEVQNGRLGGVIDAITADRVRGLEVPQVGLSAEDSLADALYANLLGPVLALPSFTAPDETWLCRTPDIDVDRDGLEAFCDSTPSDAKSTVGACIDGDGTIIEDEVDAAGVVTRHCTEALDDEGNPRFVDGVSVELNFQTKPALLPQTLP